MEHNFTLEGHIVDHHHREIFEGSVVVEQGRIAAIRRHATTARRYIICGFVDGHVHIESSMLTPEHFAQMVLPMGTVAVVSDPHEIANVMGVEGIEYMLESSERAPIGIYFTIPSSVPATPFDVAGGEVRSEEVERLACSGHFVALSEVMNVPGVLGRDEEVMRKIETAHRHNLPIDGHAPTLSGDPLRRYIGEGISTDHECTTLAEAEEKLSMGMKILICEGSSSCNYEALKPIIATHPTQVMFCTDDAHPDTLLGRGHIDHLLRRGVADGFDLFDLLHVASTNAIEHYSLPIGMLRVGDSADFLVVSDLQSFKVEQLYIAGEKRFDATLRPPYPTLLNASLESMPNSLESIPPVPTPSEPTSFNRFNHESISVEQLRCGVSGAIRAIELVPNQLLSATYIYTPPAPSENLERDLEADLLKLVYVNRYTNAAPQVAYCRGFKLRSGAIASSISHDSHNLIAVGCSDEELTRALNGVIASRGGLSICEGDQVELLPLPVAGIMSDRSAEVVAKHYSALCDRSRQLGCVVDSPFMTLSFLALVVIPELKMGEKGLFSYSAFDWIGMEVE